jgi:hypothetical protein
MSVSISHHEQELLQLKQQIDELAESRKKLVVDITLEREFYERRCNRYEIQIAALEQRMLPFLKLEEANTVAEQLKTWNALNPKPKQNQKTNKTRRPIKKLRMAVKAKRQSKKTTNSVARRQTMESVETHLL